MNSIKINIELTVTQDGTWHAEAVAANPEAIILHTPEHFNETLGFGDVCDDIFDQILDWMNALPEETKPGYRKPGLLKGSYVEHARLPGTPLEVIDGPKESVVYPGISFYSVRLPGGYITTALESNLRQVNRMEG